MKLFDQASERELKALRTLQEHGGVHDPEAKEQLRVAKEERVRALKLLWEALA